MESLHPVVVGFLVVVVALGLGQVALLALVLALEVGLVQLGDYLSFLYYAVVIHVEFLHDAGYLGADFHLHYRLDCSGCGHIVGDDAGFHPGCLEGDLGTLLSGAKVLPEADKGQYDNYSNPDVLLFHIVDYYNYPRC